MRALSSFRSAASSTTSASAGMNIPLDHRVILATRIRSYFYGCSDALIVTAGRAFTIGVCHRRYGTLCSACGARFATSSSLLGVILRQGVSAAAVFGCRGWRCVGLSLKGACALRFMQHPKRPSLTPSPNRCRLFVQAFRRCAICSGPGETTSKDGRSPRCSPMRACIRLRCTALLSEHSLMHAASLSASS